MESTAEKVDLPSVSKEFSLLFCGERACQPGHSFGPAVREHYMMQFFRPAEKATHLARRKDFWFYRKKSRFIRQI